MYKRNTVCTYGDDSLKESLLKKKFVRVKEGAVIYSLGQHTFRKIAEEAGACYRLGGILLINTELIDECLETFKEEF